MESVWSVSKLSTESVGSRRQLVYATADEAVAYMFYSCCFFLFFSVRKKNMRKPFSGTAERIFMKFLPNDTGENGVCNVVPPPGESRAEAWRMLICVIYAMTGRHARRLRYKIMSAQMDLI